MSKNEYWAMGIGVWLIILVAIFVATSFGEIKKLDQCKNERIRKYVPTDFVWQGILDGIKNGTYQPKCI
ncbi:hypothetical protein KBC75_00195 [Candidatus Shapirobacteria bacterium]|nr:hypothetical protein [Candidatus Shapirobacteria bacterium]